MNDAKFKIDLIKSVILAGLSISLCLLVLSIFSSEPENKITQTTQITCFEKEVYVLGKGNVSCILCKDDVDNYMTCDYDRVNRSLKGVFYR